MQGKSRAVLWLLSLLLSTQVGAVDIRTQKLTMVLPDQDQTFVEALLPGEIAETDVEHIILAGPISEREKYSRKQDHFLIFFKGIGTMKTGSEVFEIEPESIALINSRKRVQIEVLAGDTLHYLHITKRLSKQDLEDIKSFPKANRQGVYFRKFSECEAYTEKIKSPNTVSRTVLPKNHAPRVAMGTVDTKGPDAVGAHEHPMLDQLFLGLAGNDVMVFADEDSVKFEAFELLHIPIGASHWVTVGENRRMYYQWMDFFLTTDGQEWLKTHKAIKDYKKP